MNAEKEDALYWKALEEADRDAAATLLLGILLTTAFWAVVYFTADVAAPPGAFPLWFKLAVGGGYVASVICAFWLAYARMRSVKLNFAKRETTP